MTGRGVSSGTILNSNIECTTGCPTSTASNRTINNNHQAGAFYWDTNIADQGDMYSSVAEDRFVFSVKATLP